MKEREIWTNRWETYPNDLWEDEDVPADPKDLTPRDPKYLDWLKEQRCVKCGFPANPRLDVVPAHYGPHGMGIKASDLDALPLCVECHALEHRGAMTFWAGMHRQELVDAHRQAYEDDNGN